MNAIETHGLSRNFANRVAVSNLNLAIPRGSVFGFLGPNGAGKTTTVRMLAALIAPTSGQASVAGYQLGSQNTAIRRAVGILTEQPGLYDRLTAAQNLVFFARLYDLSRSEAEARATQYLELLNLGSRSNDLVGGFSRGMRQKLAIARALLHQPEIVFLDEPTAALDPEAARGIREIVRELRNRGYTVFLTTHNLAEAAELCDLVGIFRGQLLSLDTPARLSGSGDRIQIELAEPAEPFVANIQALPFVIDASAEQERLLVTLATPEHDNPALIAALIELGAPIRYVERAGRSLEEAYLELIGTS